MPYAGDVDVLLGEVERFVRSVSAEEATFERVLTTVLFTDIVGSTEKAAAIGDGAWKTLVERHHATVRAMIGRYRGTEVDTAGDGFFATFDGPARSVRCAQAIVEAVQPIGLEVRAGVHTGEVEVIDDKGGGIAVNIGARVRTSATRGGVGLADRTGSHRRIRAGARGRGGARVEGCPRRLAPLPRGGLVAHDPELKARRIPTAPSFDLSGRSGRMTAVKSFHLPRNLVAAVTSDPDEQRRAWMARLPADRGGVGAALVLGSERAVRAGWSNRLGGSCTGSARSRSGLEGRVASQRGGARGGGAPRVGWTRERAADRG